MQRRNSILSLGLVLALAAAACGGGTSDEGQSADGTEVPDSAATSETEDTAAPGGDAGEGAIMTMAWPSVASNLDSAVYQGLVSHNMGVNYMGTLFRYDPDAATETEVVCAQCLTPELAESAEIAEDGLSYTIKLREGVMSSSGNEMTAKDVEWSFDRANEVSAITGAFLFAVAGVDKDNPIDVIDDYTITFNLKANNQIAKSILAWYGTGVYDTAQIEADGGITDDDPWAQDYLGSNTPSFGPYTLASMTPGEEVRLVANPNYWRGPASVGEVVVRAIPDPGNRVQLLLAGDIDYTYDIQFDQVAPINESDNAYVIEAIDTNRDDLVLNHQDPVLANVDVRRAISMAINRDALVTGPYGGLALPALDGLSSFLPHPAATADKLVTYDPAAAQALIEAADIPADWSLEITYNLGRPGPHAEDVATLLAADLTAVGIPVKLTAVPSLADFEAAVGEKSLQSWLYTERPIIADAAYSISLYLGSASTLNSSSYASDELDALFGEALVTPPGDERDDLIAAANELVLDAQPIIYLVERPDFQAFSNSIDGFRSYPDGSIFIYELSKS